MIDSYEFGVIVIDGNRYTSDVIILSEKVIDDWWRKEGHKLHLEDLEKILEHESKPEVLVVGTGYYGFVKVSPEINNALKSRGIEFIAQPSENACQTFNQLLKSKRRVAGAFHLTC